MIMATYHAGVDQLFQDILSVCFQVEEVTGVKMIMSDQNYQY